ncbi:MAG TPA: hypothetical protein VIG99_16805 [Myxococcaceae bacterium]
MALANGIFDLQSMLDPSKSAAENAGLVLGRANANLGGCGSATQPQPQQVSIAFGSAPGCAFGAGTQVSGTVNVTIDPYVTGAGFFLMGAAVNGTGLDGILNLRTTTTPAFYVISGNLQTANPFVMVGGSRIALTDAASSMTLDGDINAQGERGHTFFKAAGVTWNKGACFPNGGSIRLIEGFEQFQTSVQSLDVEVTFSSDSASTGKVAVTARGSDATVESMVPYGSCPP